MQELFTAMKTEIHQIFQQNTKLIQSLEDEVRSLNKKIKKTWGKNIWKRSI